MVGPRGRCCKLETIMSVEMGDHQGYFRMYELSSIVARGKEAEWM